MEDRDKTMSLISEALEILGMGDHPEGHEEEITIETAGLGGYTIRISKDHE